MGGEKMYEGFNDRQDEGNAPLRFSTIARFAAFVIMGVLAMMAFDAYRAERMTETQLVEGSKRIQNCIQLSMAEAGNDDRAAAEEGCKKFFYEADGRLPRY